MCDRYSWIEVPIKDSKGERKVEILFVTEEILKDTRLVRRLTGYSMKDSVENYWNLGDLVGHEAIRKYYKISKAVENTGVEREYTDLRRSDRFPAPLRKAIKSGKMWGLGISLSMAKDLLTLQAYKRFLKEVKAVVRWEEEIWYKQGKIVPVFRKIWRRKANRKACWR